MPTIENLIEALIDKHGLLHVLTAVENICWDKAEHITVEWQDRATSKPWEQDAKVIGSILEHVQN